MSTQQSQSRTALVEEDAEALWKAAEGLGMSRADFMKACTYAVTKTTVDPIAPRPEPDVIADDGPAEGPHSALTPGR